MHPDAARKLFAHFEKVEAAIQCGDLPEKGCYRRYFYSGHEVVHSFGHGPERQEFKCLDCKHTWTGHLPACPACKGTDEVYETNILRTARWRCLFCKHEWDSEEGEVCPACNKHWLHGKSWARPAVNEAVLPYWVVTSNPSDFRGKIVVRRWNVRDGQTESTNEHHVYDSLEQARRHRPEGTTTIPRDPQDDPVIVETWI